MLVGRESELVALVAGVQRAWAARATAIVVRGEPGIGKTALLSGLEQRTSGFRILKAHGVAGESALPYAGLMELLAPVLDLLPRLPGRRRAALEAALGLGDGIVDDPFGAYAATLSLLAEAADDQPVLALVDDAHLLDAESAHALRFSGRRLTDDRVCLVLAMREGEGVDFEAAGFEPVHLRGLDIDATHALLGDASPAVLDRLHEGTQGNPLALRELGRLLSPAQLQGRDRLPDLLPAGPAIRRAFGDRIEALPPATREALVLAAADGSGQMGTLLEALRTRDLDLDALTPAEVADLIRVDAGRLSFVHPLIRTTAYRSTTPARRRERIARSPMRRPTNPQAAPAAPGTSPPRRSSRTSTSPASSSTSRRRLRSVPRRHRGARVRGRGAGEPPRSEPHPAFAPRGAGLSPRRRGRRRARTARHPDERERGPADPSRCATSPCAGGQLPRHDGLRAGVVDRRGRAGRSARPHPRSAPATRRVDDVDDAR